MTGSAYLAVKQVSEEATLYTVLLSAETPSLSTETSTEPPRAPVIPQGRWCTPDMGLLHAN